MTLWRNRLGGSERPERIFEVVRAVIAETGVLATRHRRALDSTVLDDAVIRQDAIMQLVAQIRRVRRVVPEAEALELGAHDYDNDPGKPPCAWNDQAAIDALVTALVTDARMVLDALGDVALDEAQAEAVGLLALVAGQDVEPGDTEGTWRIAPRTAPDRMVSVIDPQSRHVHKTNHNYRDGFKAHVAVEPETGLITACEVTAGNVGDAQAAPGLLDHETGPLQILADSAYGAGEFRAALAGVHTAHIKPPPLNRAIEGGFTIDDFAIDLDARTATCPAGVTVTISANRHATFGARCNGCALRKRCTRSMTGKKLRIHEHHALLVAASQHATTDEFIEAYRQHRPMVERTIAWLVTRGHRKVRYRGIARNRIGFAHRCAAVNLRRLLNLGLHHDGNRWAITT